MLFLIDSESSITLKLFIIICHYQLLLIILVGERFLFIHMGPEDPSSRKKYPIFLLMPNFRKLQEDSKNVSLQIRSKGPQKLGPFSHFSSWEKRLSSGQKWFLRPYFPLIRGMFVLSSGLRFSFRALELPKPRVRKRSFSLTKMTFSSKPPHHHLPI